MYQGKEHIILRFDNAQQLIIIRPTEGQNEIPVSMSQIERL